MSSRRAALVVKCKKFAPWLLVFVIGLLILAYPCEPVVNENPAEAAKSSMAPDVENHWARRDVMILQRLGVVDAYPDGLFRPDDPVSRAEIVKMMVEAFRLEAVESRDEESTIRYPALRYADLDNDHWVVPFVHTALEKNLISGYPDDTIRPDETITRAEMAEMFSRLFPETKIEDKNLEFDDSEEIPDWAADAVIQTVNIGLFAGFEDNTFRADDPTTRAESAALINRALLRKGSLFNLRGSLTSSGSDVSNISLSLADEQVIDLSLQETEVYRGDERINSDELSRGEVLDVILNSQGEAIYAEVPYSSFTAVLEGTSYSDQRLRVRPLLKDEKGVDDGLGGWKSTTFYAAAGQIDDLPAGEVTDIFWDDDTKFYRQGVEARVYNLRPGDRLHIGLYGNSPLIQRVDSVSYDSWGIVENVESTGANHGTITWRNEEDEKISGNVNFNTRFDSKGVRVGLNSVSPGDHIGVVRISDSDQLNYVEVFSEDDATVIQDNESSSESLAQIPTPITDSNRELTAAGWSDDSVSISSQNIEMERMLEEPVEEEDAPENDEVFGADVLRDRLEVGGSDVTVAVVDTGIDPLAPQLFFASGGSAGLTDWRDFTGGEDIVQRASESRQARLAEGDVATKDSIHVEWTEFFYDGESFEIEGPKPAEGTLRCSWVRRDFFLGDGSADEKILVAAMKTEGSNRYDAVYVDVDGDGVLTESDLFYPVADDGDAGTIIFPGTEELDEIAVNFIVSELDPEGRLVNFGFDGNGHGTQVASVLASQGGDRGMRGVAPAVDIMALKSLTSSGAGSWENVMQAINYAAENGADIINVSVTGLHDLSGGATFESQRLSDIAKEHDVLIVTAVGNSGPGLATAYTPGDPRSTLSVGAAAFPDLVLRDYGYDLPETTVFSYSSMGPRADGTLAPSVLAPGNSFTPVPESISPGGSSLFEGTSCAAAHVSGLAALLVDGARDKDLDFTMAGVKTAIEEGAEPLDDYMPIEQGHGIINAVQAWNQFNSDPHAGSTVELSVDSGAMLSSYLTLEEARGIYLRSETPGAVNVALENIRSSPLSVSLTAEPTEWIDIPSDSMNLPGDARINLPLRYEFPEEHDVQSGFLLADDENTPTIDDRLLHTVLRPHKLDSDRTELKEEGQIGPGSWDRYFIHIPQGASHLRAEISLDEYEDGRISFQMVDPLGEQVHVSPTIGVGSYGSWGEERLHASHVIERPQAGVWEIIVNSSSSLSFYGLQESEYHFSANIASRGSLTLFSEQSEWKFVSDHDTPDYVDVDIDIVTGGELEEGRTLLDSLKPLSAGWVGDPEEVAVIPRQRMRASSDEPQYNYFDVPQGTGDLWVWVANPLPADTEMEVFLYRQDGGTMKEIDSEAGQDSQFIRLQDPQPGQYMVATRPRSDSEGLSHYDLKVEAWPETTDVQVNGPVIGVAGQAHLSVRMDTPTREGSHWAAVGLQTEDGQPVARKWLQVQVGPGPVLFSAAPFVDELSPGNIFVRDSDTLKPAEGVVSIGDELYTLDKDGTISILSTDSQRSNVKQLKVRHSADKGDWSAPIRLTIPALSEEQAHRWRENISAPLSAGKLDNPIINTRWRDFFGFYSRF